MDFLPFHREGGVDFEGEVRDSVHRLLKHLQLVVDRADVVLHFPDGVDAADELAVVLEDEGLDLVVVHLDLLVDLVVSPHEFPDGVLLQHGHNVPFGVEGGRVDVHPLFNTTN